MNAIKGTVKNGQIIFSEPMKWPDGRSSCGRPSSVTSMDGEGRGNAEIRRIPELLAKGSYELETRGGGRRFGSNSMHSCWVLGPIVSVLGQTSL